MSVKTEFLFIKTEGNNDIINLTQSANEFVKKQNIKEGILTLTVQGTTSSIINMEYEPGLMKDYRDIMEKIIPNNVLYSHDKIWGDKNGYSHLRALFFGNSKSYAIYNKELQLGTWQQIVLIDFDNKKRVRKIALQLIY